MLKVEIITDAYEVYFKEKVENFINKFEVIEIHYSGDRYFHSALIIYKEK